MVRVQFETTNASFGETPEEKQEEIIQTLVSVIDSIRRGKAAGLVIDVNGNKIGVYDTEREG